MKRSKLFSGIAAIALAAAVFSGCQKEKDIELDEKAVSKDNAYAEKAFENVGDIANEAYDMGSGNYLKSYPGNRIFLSDCATVTLDTNVFPYKLTIDFGDENCLCLDGKYRRGQIIITFNGRYRHPGTIITHTLQDYFVNDKSIVGTKVVTNMGENDNGNLYFTIEISGIVQRPDDEGTFTYNSSREREWIQGSDTGNPWDDIYLLTGTASGTRPSGLSWEQEITSPLRLELACRFIVMGTIEIRPQDRPVRILDYGTGECDNIATVTVNGQTYTIYLD